MPSPTQQERIDSVCAHRGVPAITVGQPCIVNGEEGVIMDGNSSANFDVLFVDGNKYNCHPHWKMKILSTDKQQIIYEHKD
ncbi:MULTISPECIES: hypothetical protein [Pseudoalteromonas]|uniref:Uncharacterized protein n=1 Tax=Pseudoalteromonas amylolytica TaxID=1859457 RepID=A0A1S1MT08_9GAMM|nr:MULTISPECIES: hypothetical protein [Pseudoalteromonas]OHU85518.1 hypothetical protein BFC16_19410 [Pseudoalteromonas sp. JW3]OHU91752.1 hypothetical protein BET10_08105 [Pseudoalteromonas amylolytica]